jgi:hypothetical protein
MFRSCSDWRLEVNAALWIVAQAKCGALAMAYGGPGLGKSEMTEQFAKVLNHNYISLILSQQMPEDAGGMKHPGEINVAGVNHPIKCVQSIYDETLVRAMNEPTVVHLDETNQCQPAVMAANQELWFNRPPENAVVIATANSLDVATDAFQFSTPLINRMCILDWEFDHEGWLEGMSTGKFPDPVFPILRGDWSGHKQKWMCFVSQFAREVPKHFAWNETFPKDEESRTMPWRSPRSWHRAAVCLGAAEAVDASIDTARKILAGFVGEGPALEFFTWIEGQRFPRAEDVFENPSSLQLPVKFDTATSVVNSVHCHASRVIEESHVDGHKNEAYEKGLNFCEEVFAQNREVGSAMVGKFVKLKPPEYLPKKRSHQLWDTITLSRQTVGV